MPELHAHRGRQRADPHICRRELHLDPRLGFFVGKTLPDAVARRDRRVRKPDLVVLVIGVAQPEPDRVARAGAAVIDGIGQTEAGGSGREQARNLLMSDDEQPRIDGPDDPSPLPSLFADPTSGKAGLALAGKLANLRLRCLDLAVERSRPAAPRAGAAGPMTAAWNRSASCRRSSAMTLN